jgi:hypothetical protein
MVQSDSGALFLVAVDGFVGLVFLPFFKEHHLLRWFGIRESVHGFYFVLKLLHCILMMRTETVPVLSDKCGKKPCSGASGYSVR